MRAVLCFGDDKVIEVVGIGECGDCKESNIKSSHALSGNNAVRFRLSISAVYDGLLI
ncbi:hypothetical protein Hanom_Chr12g01074051 [Helianthus anomalus]